MLACGNSLHFEKQFKTRMMLLGHKAYKGMLCPLDVKFRIWILKPKALQMALERNFPNRIGLAKKLAEPRPD